MVNGQETIKKTRLFGLNTYEAKIWTALLSKDVSTAGELSDIANVPRSRSYDVLEGLEKKGFVVIKSGKPIKYLAVPPQEVLKNVKKRIQKKTERRLLDMNSIGFNNLINTLQEIYDNTTNHTENIVAILKGRKNIHKHLNFLFESAKRSISVSVESESEDYLKIINKIKNKTKLSITPPNTGIRMLIVDEDDAIIFPTRNNEVHPDYDVCIWIQNKQIASFLKQLSAAT